MSRQAIIIGGNVVNVAEVTAGYVPPQGSTLVQLDPASPVAPGWAYDGSTFSAPAALVASVPAVISRRQFFQACAVQGWITQDEALAAVQTGAIPANMLTAIAGLPPDQQFAAKMLVSGATDFRLSHPLVGEFATALGKSSDDVDALFTLASTL